MAVASVHVPLQSDMQHARMLIDRLVKNLGESVLGNVLDVVDNVTSSVIDSMANSVAMLTGNGLVNRATVLERLQQIQEDRGVLSALLQSPGIPQRTKEWYAARETLVTASDFAQALGCAKFGTQKQFFIKKCGFEEVPFNSSLPPLKWGTMYEPVACAAYEKRCKTKVHEFGLLRHPEHSFMGASPDGINDQGVLLEIKCPYKRKITGEVPMQYYYQIQGQLDVTGLRACDYMECEFQEYANWDAMDADVSPCGRYAAGGEEHGFVVEVLESPAGSNNASNTSNNDNDDKTTNNSNTNTTTNTTSTESDPKTERYMYSSLGLTVAELRAEFYKLSSTRVNPKHVYLFKLAKTFIARIERNDAFIRDMSGKLSDVWNRVLEYRSDKAAYDKATTTVYPSGAPAKRSTQGNVLKGAENAVSLASYAFLELED